jgi:hypothetical protein
MLNELAMELGMDEIEVVALVGEACAGEIMELREARRGRRINPMDEEVAGPRWEMTWCTPEAALVG